MTIKEPTRNPRGPQPPSPLKDQDEANPASDGQLDMRGGANMYGAFSIETFCDQGALSLTHDDTWGFLEYTEKFTPRNFWYQDAGVKIWAYQETYDNWQNTYGMDAVRVAYHCGHGGMDANGVFYVPMGAAWAGNDCTATSTTMRFGNEYLRYVFWSTCESLRVLGGHTPIRTWSAANLGMRMIFGFETVSWDDANYGRGFWNHWKRGESFSSAWLNSSWDIAHDQAPSVAALGSSAEDAQNRLANERFFYPGAASTAWWWWSWYNTAASAVRQPVLSVPRDPRLALLASPGSRSVRTVAERFGVDESEAEQRRGFVSLGADGRQVTVGDDGVVTAILASANTQNRSPISRRAAIGVAEGVVRRYGLDSDADLVLDRVVDIQEGGGSEGGDGSSEGPFTTGKLVQYRQKINGLPVITPGSGAVQVTLDNDGTVTQVRANTREVQELSDQPRAFTPEPSPSGDKSTSNEVRDPDSALAQAFSERLRNSLLRGPAPIGFTTVPGTYEIGYDIRGSEAILIAQRAVQVDFDGGYSKRYWVKAPLFA
ncbi:MAG: DUF6345 domain-containing protein [Mycetocola sp.]